MPNLNMGWLTTQKIRKYSNLKSYIYIIIYIYDKVTIILKAK